MPPAPYPVAKIICGICAQDWTAHLRLAVYDAEEDPTLDSRYIQGIPRLEHCVHLLMKANAGPPGPVGPMGATGRDAVGPTGPQGGDDHVMVDA